MQVQKNEANPVQQDGSEIKSTQAANRQPNQNNQLIKKIKFQEQLGNFHRQHAKKMSYYQEREVEQSPLVL